MEDPSNIVALEDAGMVTKLEISPMVALSGAIAETIDSLYGNVFAEKAIEDFKKRATCIRRLRR